MDEGARDVVVRHQSELGREAQRSEAGATCCCDVVDLVASEGIAPLDRAVLLAEVRCSSAG